MTKLRIKNIVITVTLILAYCMTVQAAPGDEIDKENESTVNQGVGGYIMESAAPSLDLPNQLLQDTDKVIDKASYEEASKIVRGNINIVANQIKNYTEYKETVNEKIARFTQNEDNINISDENKVKVKELIKKIPQEVKKEKAVAAEDSIGTLINNEEYYKALEKLSNTLKSKQDQLADIEKTISIWQQIDALID